MKFIKDSFKTKNNNKYISKRNIRNNKRQGSKKGGVKSQNDNESLLSPGNLFSPFNPMNPVDSINIFR